MSPLLSITLSAYNLEPFLRDCLDCIVNQTLHDIEIICINDGSSDGTLDILQEFAKRDSRLIVINKQVNEGLAVARNEAMALARGKYVGFIDGDDLLDQDLFRKACARAEETKCDLLLWDYVTFWNESQIAKKALEPSSLLSIDPSDKVALLNRPAFAWTKLIRKEKIKEFGLSFPKGLTYQDIPVHWRAVTQTDRIALLPERLSYYRQQPAATTHRSGWKRADLAIVMDMVREYLEETGFFDKYRDVFIQKQLESLCGVFDVVDPSLKSKAMQIVRERLTAEHWQYLHEGKPLRWQVRDFYMSLHGSLSAKSRRAAWLSARWCYRGLRLYGN